MSTLRELLNSVTNVSATMLSQVIQAKVRWTTMLLNNSDFIQYLFISYHQMRQGLLIHQPKQVDVIHSAKVRHQ